MKREVTFGIPEDITLRRERVVVLRFPFSVRSISEDAPHNVATQHFVDVQISVVLMVGWGFNHTLNPLTDRSLVKTLFQCAREEIESKLRSEDFKENYEVKLASGNSPKQNPYDLSEIPNPEGFSFWI